MQTAVWGPLAWRTMHTVLYGFEDRHARAIFTSPSDLAAFVALYNNGTDSSSKTTKSTTTTTTATTSLSSLLLLGKPSPPPSVDMVVSFQASHLLYEFGNVLPCAKCRQSYGGFYTQAIREEVGLAAQAVVVEEEHEQQQHLGARPAPSSSSSSSPPPPPPPLVTVALPIDFPRRVLWRVHNMVNKKLGRDEQPMSVLCARYNHGDAIGRQQEKRHHHHSYHGGRGEGSIVNSGGAAVSTGGGGGTANVMGAWEYSCMWFLYFVCYNQMVNNNNNNNHHHHHQQQQHRRVVTPTHVLRFVDALFRTGLDPALNKDPTGLPHACSRLRARALHELDRICIAAAEAAAARGDMPPPPSPPPRCRGWEGVLVPSDLDTIELVARIFDGPNTRVTSYAIEQKLWRYNTLVLV